LLHFAIKKGSSELQLPIPFKASTCSAPKFPPVP
jgi:hypothetical protein